MKPTKYMKLIFLFLASCSISCQEKTKSENPQNNIYDKENLTMITKTLEKQLKQGSNQYLDEPGVEVPKKEFEIEELEACTQIAKNILITNDFKVLNSNDFNKKINLIFKRIIDPHSENQYLYVNYFDKCDKKFNKNPNNSIDYNGTYIIKNMSFITNFYYIPELVDYQKEFPEIAKNEDFLPVKYKDKEGNNCSIELWKKLDSNIDEGSNLSTQRKKNIQLLVARNKYLFNDNKASLAWLKFNDKAFLESLIKTFGYVQDVDLLKWVLDQNLTKSNYNVKEFAKILWIKTCDNKLIFHKEVFDIMNTENETNKKKYIESLQNYMSYFNTNNLSFSEEAKIKGLISYYSTKLSGSIEPNNVFYFFPFVNDKKYEEEFIKNNYYNLPDFKTLYEETRNGGASLPGQE